MSGLAALLAGHEAPGVHRWHGAFDVADVRHTVEHAGWGFGYVDGWTRADSKSAFLAEVGETLGFPDYYGQNFDALADCLHDIGSGTDGVVLLWDGWATLARADEKRTRVRELRGKGLSVRAIAAETGYSVGTVHRYVKEAREAS